MDVAVVRRRLLQLGAVTAVVLILHNFCEITSSRLIYNIRFNLIELLLRT